jgi:hypothetical protein
MFQVALKCGEIDLGPTAMGGSFDGREGWGGLKVGRFEGFEGGKV